MRLQRSVPRRLLWAVALTLATITGLGSRAAAQDNVYEDTSLALVPADAAVYSASLRLEEQWQIFAKSNAAKRIMQNAVVQMGWGQAQMMWNGSQEPQIQMMKELLNDPQNQRLIALVREAFSHEFFFYANDDVAKLLALANRLNGTINTIQIEAAQADDPEAAMANRFADLALQEADNIRIPDVVMGWRYDDSEAAGEQLDRLEATVAALLQQEAPFLADRWKRQELGGGDFVTLSLDGSLIPWDQADLDDFPGDPEKAEKLIAKAKEMTLTITLGQLGDYLLFSIGDSADHLLTLGQGETLADRAEFAKMRQHADQRIVSIGYVSEAFMKQANNVQQQMEDLKGMIGTALEASDLPESVQEKITKGGGEIIDDLKGVMPGVGAQFGYSYLVDNGIEGYAYNWGEKMFDDSAPLTLTDHVGGNPILAFVARGNESPEDYDTFVNMMKKMVDLVDDVATDQLGDDEKAQYEKVRDAVMPMLKRLDTANRDNLMPALSSNESAIVLDAKVKSAQPHNMMPLATNVLPLPEMAITMKVEDAGKLKAGVSEYFAVAQQMMDMLHEMEPNDFPDVKIPSPEVNEEDWGTSYQYRLPVDWGVDDQIAPNAGLSQNLAVMSLAPQTTSRLMAKSNLAVDKYRVDLSKPAGSLVYFDFNGLIDMIEPWVNYGVDAGVDDAFVSGMVKAQVSDWTAILKCYKGTAAVTTTDEDGVTVTHSHSLFEDL